MRVLLIGEFSALHWNLKRGLVSNGHTVTVLANGDGFKKVPFDVKIGPRSTGRLELVKYLLFDQPALVKQLSREADVIQFINPSSLVTPAHGRAQYAISLLHLLDQFQGIVSLLVAGCDAYVFPLISQSPRSPCPGCIADGGRYPCGLGLHLARERELAEAIAARADVVIPMGGAIYGNAYRGHHPNVAPQQNFPMPVGEFRPVNQRRGGPLRILHGINRPGFKGTHAILGCLERLSTERPEIFEVKIPERLSLTAYQEMVSSTNVLVDQLHADCLGMNALQSLGQGRIVMTAFDPNYKSGAVDYSDCPAVDISGGVSSLESSLFAVAQWDDDRLSLESARGIEWVRTHCDPRLVASRLEECWRTSRTNRGDSAS